LKFHPCTHVWFRTAEQAKDTSDDSDGDETEDKETDEDRRKTMMESTANDDLAGLRFGTLDFNAEASTPEQQRESSDIEEITPEEWVKKQSGAWECKVCTL
jgi:hypothetical protein